MSEGGNPLRWDVDTVAFRMDPELVKSLPEGSALGAVTMAFEAWRGLPRVPDLVMTEGLPETPGHHGGERATNGVYLVRDWQGEPDQLAITVVTYNRNTGEVFDADVLVNANASYALLDETAPVDVYHYDLGAIMTHEAGHCLGLDESETHPEATMWPLVSPGETHQRSLSEDDETGAITNYAGSVPDAPLGCGMASVLGRPGRKGNTLMWSLLVLAGAAWLARTARKQSAARRVLAFGLGSALIVAPIGSAPEAGEAHADDARHALADAGHAATHGALARVPAAWLSADEPAAQARLARAFGPAASPRSLVRGRAYARTAAWKNGFIVTEHVVRDEAGQEHSFEVRGGTVGELTQRWVHDAAGPQDGAEVIVAADAAGKPGWAYYDNGLVFGGSLGHGPAIRIAQ